MAQFREVTLVGGDKITINLDEVRAMHRAGDSTTVYFDQTHVFHVEETPSEILAAHSIDRRL